MIEPNVILNKLRTAWGFLLTKLNASASLVFLYLSMNDQLPPPIEALLDRVGEPWQTIARLAVPMLWFALVQHAKARAINVGK